MSFLIGHELESLELISPVFAAFMITLLHDTYLDMIQDYGKQDRFDQAEIIRAKEGPGGGSGEADVATVLRVRAPAHTERPPQDPGHRRAQQEALTETRH